MGTFLLENINYILSFAFIDAIVYCNVPDIREFGPLGLCLSPGRQWAPKLRISITLTFPDTLVIFWRILMPKIDTKLYLNLIKLDTIIKYTLLISITN